jgi:hypothetical protein
MFGGPISRPAPGVDPPSRAARWLDSLGLDSLYDYDPVWQRCVDLGVSPTFHTAAMGWTIRASVSNYVFNHIGMFAIAGEMLALSLFMGGVPQRFPQLRFAFQEGGVAWAAALLANLVGHWEKRNRDAIVELDPDLLDVDALLTYFAEYGDAEVTGRLDELREYFGRPAARPAQVDEFAAVGIDTADDLRARFEPNFYFGCEADDPLVAWAFRDDVNPLGARLRPVLGSDISHWDVRDMTEPIAEAYELVEHGVITERDFRDLTFVNPVRLHAGPNPRFFEGTVVEAAATQALAEAGEVWL